ncbi:MAG: hypothetical protein ACXU9K_11560 [Thermodesulfobacteriota bacterium]
MKPKMKKRAREKSSLIGEDSQEGRYEITSTSGLCFHDWEKDGISKSSWKRLRT